MVAQLSDVADKTFDYVIVGGGTAGLTLAARLVEDPNVTVAVLEAGEANLNDPKILIGGSFGATFGDPKYDWGYRTVAQKHSNNRELWWNRGKGLGGSSAMNFLGWLKPPAADINAHEELGNPGWNWESYHKYTLRTEEFTAATKEQLKIFPHTHTAEYRGTSGGIKTTVPGTFHHLDNMFLESAQKHNIPLISDPYGGNTTGCWMASTNLDRKAGWSRSYAATAYYLPFQDKPNFTVLVEATAARIIFADETVSNDLVATGVEFIHGGKTHVVHAKKEVIVAAGTIASPQIIELSGIGRPEILKKIGVPVKVELPGVGENVQDHPYCGVSYELNTSIGHQSFDLLRIPEFAKEQASLNEQNLMNLYRYGITSFIYIPLSLSDPAEHKRILNGLTDFINEQKAKGTLPPGLAEQYEIQLRHFKDETVPDMEVLAFPGWITHQSAPEPGKPYVTMMFLLNHPFSRGKIHARTNNPLDHPEIDPHIFENPWDAQIMAEHIKLIRKLAQTEPFKSGVVKEVDPGPECTTDEQLIEYLKNHNNTTFHAIGSLSMLPREKNGVVDPELRVYGTRNLRVADLSIVPLHVAAHTQATAYAIGEKLADILKGVK